MKSEKIFEAIGGIREDIVDSAARHSFKKRRRWLWTASVAAMLVLVIVLGSALSPWSGSYAIAVAEYPETVQCPEFDDYVDENGELDWEGYDTARSAWRADVDVKAPSGYADSLDSFLAKSIGQFLSGAGDGNIVYSPLNVYMALAMTAELSDGDSRQQILSLLGSGSMDELRTQASLVWRSSYRDDGATTSVLASSLWLDKDVRFVQSTMDTLAESYYASSYRGEMGSEDFNAALRDWLNRQTGGLLREQAGDVELDVNTVLALATTVYFNARWQDEFSESLTEADTFHGAAGDLSCDFMHTTTMASFVRGENFTSLAWRFINSGGEMLFLLPEEGLSPEALLGYSGAMEYMISGGQSIEGSYCEVNFSLPKFDVSSALELSEGLKALGVTDIFDREVSDFSPMTSDIDGNIYVSQVQHAARVSIDEEGCTAAAFTVELAAGDGLPPETVDFVLDRPFIFVITNPDGLPLFVGIVNQPA